MKICFFTHSIFNLGGIQRVLSVVANELSKYHDIDIICTNSEYKENRELYNLNKNVNIIVKDNFFEKKILKKVTSKIIRYINIKTGLLNNKYLYKGLMESYYPKNSLKSISNYFNEKNYDVIIGVGGEYSLILGCISNYLVAKTIGWQHNSYDAYLKNKNRYFWQQDELFKRYIPQLDEHIVLTEYDKNKYKSEMNLDSTVIHNPKSFESNKKSSLKNKQFLAAGRFNYQKGFDLLIESFKLFNENNKEWKLIIIGDGEEKDKINQKIDEYKLKDFVIVEDFTSNITRYFIESSILLLPSRWEGMPMIVLESMEMGVPIISYNISACEQLLTTKKHGILVDKFDIKKFADAMLDLSNSYDLRIKLGKNLIERSEDFSVDNICSQWIKLLNTL